MLLILIPLLLLIVMDFKHRYVLMWQLGLFALLQFIGCIWMNGTTATFHNTLYNFVILFVIAILLKIYLFIRFKGKAINAIGAGDLFFLPLLSPYFTYHSFLIFLIISLTITLLSWIVYCKYRNDVLNKVPLITGVGVCYLGKVIFDLINLH